MPPATGLIIYSWKLLNLSHDNVKSHIDWINDVEAYIGKCKVPITTDPNDSIIRQLNMVDPDKKDLFGQQLLSRGLHVVRSDKKIKLSMLYLMMMGRNMDEVVRVIDTLMLASKSKFRKKMDGDVIT